DPRLRGGSRAALEARKWWSGRRGPWLLPVRMSLPRMHWMCLRCQVGLGKPHHLTAAAPVEEPLDVVVVPTIDAERELAEITLVGQLVAPPGLPVPSGHAETDLHRGC